MQIENEECRDWADIGALLDSLYDEVAVLDANGVIVFANRAWRDFCSSNDGQPDRCLVGVNYLKICKDAEGPSSAEARMIPEGFARALNTGEPFHCEYPCDSPNEKRWFELTATRYARGKKLFLIVQHRNITKRVVESEEIEEAFVNSSALTALVATTSDAILSYDLDGQIIIWNRAAERLYGYTQEEAMGQSLELLYPRNWPKSVTEYRDEIIAGKLESFEATRVAKDGTEREVWISCAPIRSADGDVVAISNIHRDISEVRKAERARDLIAHEVIHRAKNMLSVVTAIQRQTARSEPTAEGFHRSFDARLRSLARSTDLLVRSAWTTVSLRDLVAGHLQPFALPDDGRLQITGRQVDLQPQAVQAIGMAVHELATNSSKYGALCQDNGKIRISWEIVENSRHLRIDWRETGTSAKSMTERRGFGSTVLTDLTPAMLNATSSFQVGVNSVEWSVTIGDTFFKQN